VSADWHLARTGYPSQRLDEPVDPDRPDNLWRAVGGDDGSRSRFEQRAHPRNWQLKLRILVAEGLRLLAGRLPL